jgi:hypothetical protein
VTQPVWPGLSAGGENVFSGPADTAARVASDSGLQPPARHGQRMNPVIALGRKNQRSAEPIALQHWGELASTLTDETFHVMSKPACVFGIG